MEQKPPRRRCTAKRTNGEPCNKPPVRGALICASHGGSAPQVKAKAALRLAEQEVRAGLARLDVGPVEDPFSELAKLAGQVVAWKDALAEKVNQLTDQLRYEAHGAGTEQLRAEVALFERALDRCAAVLGLIVKLGLEERLARISEKQAEVVLRAVDAAVVAIQRGSTPAEARSAAARELRATS